MKNVKIFSLAFAIIAAVFISSCGKKGCTDASAANYCDMCKKEDGSCEFEGQVVFWYNQATSDSVRLSEALRDTITLGVGSALNYYIEDASVGSLLGSSYSTSAPDCGTIGALTSTQNVGTNKIKSFRYRVTGFRGVEYWSGTVVLKAYECTKVQLVWNE